MDERRTPKIYQTARNRGVLLAEKSGVGISFDTVNGPIYLYLDIENATSFCKALGMMLDNYRLSHSLKSEGIASTEVSATTLPLDVTIDGTVPSDSSSDAFQG